jgi:Ribbon-helix-helix protein, copG family
MNDKRMNESRINARVDGATQERLNELVLSTGQSISHVVREAIAVYHAQVRKAPPQPKRLLAMVGKYRSGHTDSASRYKEIVAEAIEDKHARTQRPATKKRA